MAEGAAGRSAALKAAKFEMKLTKNEGYLREQ